MLKNYYSLTKPSMVRGNAILAAAGFLVGSHHHIHLALLIATLVGISLVIASGCVCNNYIDRNIDAHMNRTKGRALVLRTISNRQAILFATVLFIIGSIVLFFYTPFITVLIATIGFIFYVVLYSPLKHRSIYGALVGSVAGAVPIVAGYCAAAHGVDTTALILFLILVFWQMPHFYSIALYRSEEYALAAIPVFPLIKGIYTTKIHIIFYILAFIIATGLLFMVSSMSITYMFIIGFLGLVWLGFGLYGFSTIDTSWWARRMFIISLVVIMTLSVTLAFGAVL